IFTAWRLHSGRLHSSPTRRSSDLVALSNPKSLVYVLALLPQFVDTRQPVGPQLMLLAAIAIAADVSVGTVYVAAGGRLSRAMARPAVRLGFERAIGTVFLGLAAVILAELAWHGGPTG